MKLLVSFFACTLFANTSVANTGPQSGARQHPLHQPVDRPNLDTHIDDFRTSGRTLIATLVDLAYEFHLPMGIEYVDREATTRPINLEFHEDSIRTIVSAVVAELPQYRVAFQGEVIELYSQQSREDPSNPLNKSIANYSVAAADTRDADLALVCALSKELGPVAFCGGSITNGQWGTLKITLHLHNAKVYQILHTIVQQNGQAIWVVATSPENLSKTQAGSLWHVYPLQAPFRIAVLEKLRSIFS